MKTIQKHFCTVLPRVRSNSLSSPRKYSNSSALSLFDSSAPPPSRPTLSSNRLSIEGKPAEAQNSQHNSHSHPPFSLALAQPQSSSSQALAHSSQQGQYALFPYSSLAHSPCPHPPSSHPSQDPHHHPRPKRQRLRYQLDVGAYGIPKRCRPVPTRRHPSASSPSGDPLSLAVQVGEDAYFVRDNAMGVADGVGGWAKSHPRPSSATPSALFARRLMHYCAAEIGTVTTPSLADSPPPPPPASPPLSSTASPLPIPNPPSKYQSTLPPSRPHFSFTHHLRPRPGPSPSSWAWSGPSVSSSLPASWSIHDVFSAPPNNPPVPDHTPSFTLSDRPSTPIEDLEQDLEDSLQELSEGIDVLQILERAYDKTLKAHVISTDSLPQRPDPAVSSSSASPSSTQGESNSRPLLEGSSTALLAVLDHPPRQSANPSPSPPTAPTSSSSSNGTTIITSSSSATPLSANFTSAETPLKATTATASATSKVECELVEESPESKGEYDAVIKIAHVGDCMGMLVRGEDIVWRSDEMWWDFNTPVQLGPSTSTSVTPRNSATVITLPVKANDILILASDGLSDNLWDEDVLDEVVRFKKTFLDSVDAAESAAAVPKEEEEEDSGYSSESSTCSTLGRNSSSRTPTPTPTSTTATTTTATTTTTTTLKRKSLAGMLSEALCSRARRVSERSPASASSFFTTPRSREAAAEEDKDEIPFARRAREVGKRFYGGKNDDISVVVAVISPRAE